MGIGVHIESTSYALRKSLYRIHVLGLARKTTVARVLQHYREQLCRGCTTLDVAVQGRKPCIRVPMAHGRNNVVGLPQAPCVQLVSSLQELLIYRSTLVILATGCERWPNERGSKGVIAALYEPSLGLISCLKLGNRVGSRKRKVQTRNRRYPRPD